MSDHRLAAPLALALPGGVLAEYVAGSDPPRYAVGGEPVAVDVTIPDDLVATGWHWYGSFLHVAGDYPLFVATNTYPPPGWPGDRRDCFAVARAFDLSERPAAPEAAPRRTKQEKAQPVQLTLFEEVA